MKFLVFSDSHRRTSGMISAIEKHKNKCDAVIFLGDGLDDIEYIRPRYPQIAFYAVCGNCDFFSSGAEKEMMLSLDGIKIFITHGHLYGAKGGYGRLVQEAEKRGADAVFFGHTHVPCDDVWEINGKSIRLFNPGSITAEGYYGVVNTSNGVLITNHGKISQNIF
ncbi:MAG: YfcE family phosphodiesterase [Clostridia bacterium]|nr:YfcE family phosphodiesterase [Clostridia bacterium]